MERFTEGIEVQELTVGEFEGQSGLFLSLGLHFEIDERGPLSITFLLSREAADWLQKSLETFEWP